MAENTPVKPTRKKGIERAKFAEMIADEMRKGNLTAFIARSADFYGPNTPLNLIGG